MLNFPTFSTVVFGRRLKMTEAQSVQQNSRLGPPRVDTVSLRFGGAKEDLVQDLYQAFTWYETNHDMGKLESALQKAKRGGVDFNATQESAVAGFTPIHFAVRFGDVEVLKRVLALGAGVDLPARDGRTALHLAAGWGKMEMIQTLLGAGANKDAAPTDGLHEGHTPFMEAVAGQSIEAAKVLLALGADINVKGWYGHTPLSKAAENGDSEMVAWLLENGADPHVADDSGSTPLMLLSQKEDGTTGLKALLEQGVDVNARSKDGQPVWRYVIHSRPEDLMEKLDLLLGKGLDVHGRMMKSTPLLYAASCGKLAVVKKLVALGADLTAKTDWGRDLFAQAASSCDVAVTDYVLNLMQGDSAAVFNVNTRDNEGQTPLMDVISRGVYDGTGIVDYLLSKGADVNLKNNAGETVLMQAAENWRVGIMPKLLSLGVEMNARNNEGKTALMVAVEQGCRKAFDILIEAGADVRIKDNRGKTVFDYIVEKKDQYWYGIR